MGPEYQPLSPAQSCRSLILEPSECFICREVELATSDRLRNFCDCKTLVAHHACLSTWIQTRRGSEDRLLCVVCKAEYQVQRRSPWWSLGSEWRSWLVLVPALVLLALVPYVVHCLMTAFTKPPPPISFKVAAVTFGLLTEFLLIKCVSRYLSTRYCQAERSAFTVRARGSEEDRPGPVRGPGSSRRSSFIRRLQSGYSEERMCFLSQRQEEDDGRVPSEARTAWSRLGDFPSGTHAI